MSCSDSMFLLEIKAEELKSYIGCKEFIIKCYFADVFHIKLKDPNGFDPLIPILGTTVNISNTKMKVRKAKAQKPLMKAMAQVGQSIWFTSSIDTLITTMKNCPIELSLFDTGNLAKVLGSTHIPWRPVYIDYLLKLKSKVRVAPVHSSGTYNIYDDFTSKRMASIRLNIKLTHIKDKVTSFRSLSKGQALYNTELIIKRTPALSAVKEPPFKLKTKSGFVFSNKSNRKFKSRISDRSDIIRKTNNKTLPNKEYKPYELPAVVSLEKLRDRYDFTCITKQVKSDSDFYKHKQNEVVKTKSSSSINRKHFNILKYIFGDINRPFGNQVLCVGYFTVNNALASSAKNSSNKEYSSGRSNSGDKYKEGSISSLDIADLIKAKKCLNPVCHGKIQERQVPLSPDDRIQLNITRSNIEKVEEIVGGMNTNMQFESNECFCSCKCSFEFMKRTTYCGICGGYERVGEDMPSKIINAPFPCPIYYKLADKNRQKTLSISGSDKSKNKGEDSLKSIKKNVKPELEKVTEKKRKNDRFRFNYGYKAPQLGHNRCVMPCTGTLGAVPKHMGWLWTADDVPGMKFRPTWRPGASNKHVVRALKLARYPDKIIKKKKKDTGKKKKTLKRPLLTVTKKDGEYMVTMETMKIFSKPRAPNTYPYEDKPVLTYIVGRTDEEKRERRKKKERAKRRLERDQREFIQNTFKHVCKEICLKTYQQALGILPDGEDPNCVCYPKYPGPDNTNLNLSCSCSENTSSIGSDTDSDEWIIEFTPPNATYDPSYTGKRLLKVDKPTQYTYLDYKVKLLDRYGNQVPRFFTGPDGKTQCSDLGGFWSPDHKWLEINTDGFIGPDGRWAPNVFIGPNDEQVDSNPGKFQIGNTGVWLVVGIDGYVDAKGQWKYYSKPKTTNSKKHNIVIGKHGDKRDDTTIPSEVTLSCFGDVDAKYLSKMGIFGHGHDRKCLIEALSELAARGEHVTFPQSSIVPRLPATKKHHHSKDSKQRCNHAKPSDKGIVAVDGHGNKTYFRLKNYKNKRTKQRINQLTERGISVSSFHAPCFHSFINQELMKKQQFERRMKMAKPTERDVLNESKETEYTPYYS